MNGPTGGVSRVSVVEVRTTMKANFKPIALLVGLLPALASAPVVAQGAPDSPAAPSDPASAMYSVTDLYNRLDTGAAGSKRSAAFSEPSTGPTTSASRTLDEVMGKAPAVNDSSGATPAQVLRGMTYWGTRSGGEWGNQSGTMPPTPLSKTGQTSCYDVFTNAAESCDPAGDADHTQQDGNRQAGVGWSAPRLTKNVNAADDDGAGGGIAGNGICDGTESCNGTVTDQMTGLIWLTDANCANTTRTWATALSDVVSLNGSGTINGNNCGDTSNGGSHHTDWRLPNRNELFSITDDSKTNPALPAGYPFTSVQVYNYWSSTTYAGHFDYAWGIYMGGGTAGNGLKSNAYHVWPVRGGL